MSPKTDSLSLNTKQCENTSQTTLSKAKITHVRNNIIPFRYAICAIAFKASLNIDWDSYMCTIIVYYLKHDLGLVKVYNVQVKSASKQIWSHCFVAYVSLHCTYVTISAVIVSYLTLWPKWTRLSNNSFMLTKPLTLK